MGAPAQLQIIKSQKGALAAHSCSAANVQFLCVEQISDTVDDVVGPMVNHAVVVDALKTPKGHYIFQDIQLDQ